MSDSGGGLVVKILKRTSKFDIQDSDGPSQGLVVKLNIPKKTKLFVDQTMRERENCVCELTYLLKPHLHWFCLGVNL